jgi:hypothetical protein
MTIPASPSAGTWDYENGIGLHVNFTMAAGTNFHATADTWQTGLFLSTSSQVNGIGAVTDRFRVDLVQIESGQVATDFEEIHIATELALCQRYFQKTFSQGVAPVQNVGTTEGVFSYVTANTGTGNQGAILRFPVNMRVKPLVTAYNPNAFNTNWWNGSLAATSGTFNIIGLGESGAVIFNPQVPGDLANHVFYVHATMNAEL